MTEVMNELWTIFVAGMRLAILFLLLEVTLNLVLIVLRENRLAYESALHRVTASGERRQYRPGRVTASGEGRYYRPGTVTMAGPSYYRPGMLRCT